MNGRQSRMNGSVVRTQQFSLLFHVEPVQIGASFLGFEVCSGISIGCYADTSPYSADCAVYCTDIQWSLNSNALSLAFHIMKS